MHVHRSYEGRISVPMGARYAEVCIYRGVGKYKELVDRAIRLATVLFLDLYDQ